MKYQNRYPSAEKVTRPSSSRIKKLINGRWPRPKRFPWVRPDFCELEAKDSDSVTWLGHATFVMRFGNQTLLTDPVFSERCSPVQWLGPKRYMPPAANVEELPHIDWVLISHNHYDHLDEQTVLDLVKKQPNNPPTFLVPSGLKAWFNKRGINSVIELGWGQFSDEHALHFHCVPVQHFSGRGPHDRNKTLWCGWVVEHREKRIFFAGDTGYSKDFKDLGVQFKQMDLALLPIGAYSPRWFMRAVHVDPEEAVKIHLDINAKLSIGMHWGTFILTAEPVDEPPKKLKAMKKKYQLAEQSFITLQHGGSCSF